MSKMMKEALADILQGTVDAGLKVPFSEKELNAYNVKVKHIQLEPEKIKRVREVTHLSQSVFAKTLNVSESSVRGWEQGTRTPTGPTRVLLNLLSKHPELIRQIV